MRIAFLSNLALPSSDTYGEQLACSLAALAAAGVDVELYAPRAPGVRASVDVLAGYYGFPADAPAGRLRWRPVPVPRPLRGKVSGKIWADLRGVGLSPPEVPVLTRHWQVALHALSRGRRVVFETYKTRVGGPRRPLWRHPGMVGAVTHSRLSAAAVCRAGLPEERVLVAHNGVWSTEVADVRHEPEKARTVCYAGHVRRDKGTDALLELAAGAPELDFRLLGGVPGARETESLRRRARAGGIDNLALLDRVPPREVPGLLRGADILLIPPVSAPLERWGRTVLPMKTFRYLAAARPILAPRLPDLDEVLAHNDNAWLVDPDRPREAARALRALAADPRARRRLAAGARRTALEFTWERRGELVREFLERLPDIGPRVRT